MRTDPSFRAAVLALLLVALPSSAAGQDGLGVGLRIGTTGFGVDGARALTPSLALRAGVSVSSNTPLLPTVIPSEVAGTDWDLEPPAFALNLGVDLHVGGGFRVQGGLLYRSEDLVARADISPDGTRFGTRTYTGPGWVRATLDQPPVVPYVGIGFGRITPAGFGIYADVALAIGGEASVSMVASEELQGLPTITPDLRVATNQFEDDADLLQSVYPVIQVGVRYGLGRRAP